MKLALVHNGEIVKVVKRGSRVNLPNGDVIAPALPGWKHGNENYKLVEVIPAEVPNGQILTNVKYELVDDGTKAQETGVLMARPAPFKGFF